MNYKLEYQKYKYKYLNLKSHIQNGGKIKFNKCWRHNLGSEQYSEEYISCIENEINECNRVPMPVTIQDAKYLDKQDKIMGAKWIEEQNKIKIIYFRMLKLIKSDEIQDYELPRTSDDQLFELNDKLIDHNTLLSPEDKTFIKNWFEFIDMFIFTFCLHYPIYTSNELNHNLPKTFDEELQIKYHKCYQFFIEFKKTTEGSELLLKIVDKKHADYKFIEEKIQSRIIEFEEGVEDEKDEELLKNAKRALELFNELNKHNRNFIHPITEPKEITEILDKMNEWFDLQEKIGLSVSLSEDIVDFYSKAIQHHLSSERSLEQEYIDSVYEDVKIIYKEICRKKLRLSNISSNN